MRENEETVVDEFESQIEAALQSVLARLACGEDVLGSAEWELVGKHVLALAERDAVDWARHADEFIGAYATEGIALIRRRPDTLLRAQSPWGVVVAKGRLEGRYAVGLEAVVGLTGRDATNHRIRLADAPRVVSMESLIDLEDC